jgi:molecular chaperone GrpE
MALKRKKKKQAEPDTKQTASDKAAGKNEKNKPVDAVSPETQPDETTETGTDPEVKYAELNNRYLRLLAEYDNFRKRTIKEKGEIIRTASEDLIMEFLSILDNLDLATEHKNDKTTFDDYVKGIAIIEDQIRTILSKAGLEKIETVGETFDPEIHDAVMQIESEDHEAGKVCNEVGKGYILSGKVIRHPKVVVSK